MRKYWGAIEKYSDGNCNFAGISDVHNASHLKSLQNQVKPGRNLLSLMLNTDGANKFKSNSTSVWPIQLIQNYLPPKVRYFPKNIIVAGLFYGEEKPDCMEFFFPLISELKDLMKSGMLFEIDENRYEFEPIITHCCVDLPAKRMLQCIKQYNGYCACTYCLHPGVSVETNGMKGVRYPVMEDVPVRTHDSTLKIMRCGDFKKNKKNKKHNDGVTELSCLVSMPKFDLINSFSTDYMHCVTIGATKKLLNLYFNSENHKMEYYIDDKKMQQLDKILLSIKPNREITRRPRSLNQRAHYKASEFRALLLFYFPICLKNFLPKKYFENFCQLSSTIYILLKSEISEEELKKAEKKID